MKAVLALCAAIGLLAARAAASGPTKIYIDSVPEYHLLQSCAEHQVSLVVRSMAYGCGDGSQTTSYACFCYESSVYYSRMISTRVTSACSKSGAQDKSAGEVFSKYCQLADLEMVSTTDSASSEPTSSTTSSTQSTVASPASSPATTTPSPTSTPSSSTSDTPAPNNDKKDHTAAIAAGVTVPVVVLALGLVGFLLYLHRRKQNPHASSELPTFPANQVTEAPGAQKEIYRRVELEGGSPQELEAVRAQELAASQEAQRDRKIEGYLGNNNHS